MTEKTAANRAHDAAREEDRQRAWRELHAHIDTLERENARLREERDDLRDERDELRERAEETRTLAGYIATEREKVARLERERDSFAAQLAVLREAARTYREVAEVPAGNLDTVQDVARADLDAAIADTATAVEAYTRRVQAEAVDAAAKHLRDLASEGHPFALDMAHAIEDLAAELRGGR